MGDENTAREAGTTGRGIDRIVVGALEHAKMSPSPYDDLDWFIGTGEPDEEAAEALRWLDSLPTDPTNSP